ncbi:DM13 domain-containing protein [Krasilnikovia sp. M28-CT-15]|uniref:DM13 domain-containing protein n=1 Tax=Krasilnikovia sp. M28-CT-15 TaxID=3373540 RepID=UPI003875FDD2
MQRIRSWLQRPITWLVLTAVAAAAVVGLALFQPWKLWVDRTVYEAPPAAAPPDATASAAAATSPVLAAGTFISHEHATTGTAKIYQSPDGARHLRLEDLDTSNGPLLKVWLSDAPVIPGSDGWRVFDDGRHVDLGTLKGNKGSHNYPVPADVDLSQYRSVSIWCARFHVSFGAAELIARPAPDSSGPG